MRLMKELMRYFIKGAPITALVAGVSLGVIGLAALHPFAGLIVLVALALILFSVAIGSVGDL